MKLTTEFNPIKHETGTQNCIRRFISGEAILKGAMVCVDAQGKAVPASDATGLSSVVGIALVSASAGDYVETETGVFSMPHQSVAITATTIDKVVFAKDDNSVSTTATNSVKAGVLRMLDENGDAVIEVGNI